VRARHLEGQTERAWCLTLATNAVIAWTTEYYGLAVEQMRRAGRRIDDEVLAHTSPAHTENINVFGAIEVDIDVELAQLGPTGYRLLRVLDTLFCAQDHYQCAVAVGDCRVRGCARWSCATPRKFQRSDRRCTYVCRARRLRRTSPVP
jgi:hypothetical protein